MGRILRLACSAFLLICLTGTLHAAISVGPNGAGPFNFELTPDATNIATGVLTGNAGTYVDVPTMDAGVNTITAANITRMLPTTASVPPSTFSGGFRHNTALDLIQSRPTTDGTNAAGVLLASFVNDSGASSTTFSLAYDFNVQSPATGHLPGFYVYYSLTGEPNTWVPIPGLSGSETPGPVSTTVDVGSWPVGGTLYILWADDNADGVTDPSYTIDNLFVSAGEIDPNVIIVEQPVGATVNEGFGVSFSVVAGGRAPLTYQWFRDGLPITDATNSTYTIPRVFRSDNNAMFTVQVSNDVPSSQTSDPVTLTVIEDNVPPTITCVYGTNDNLTLFVVYSEIVTNATDPVNYSVFLANDPSQQLTVATATFPGGATEGMVVVLTLDPSTPWTAPNAYALSAGAVFDVVGNVIDPAEVTPLSLYREAVFSISESQIWTFEDSGLNLGTTWRENSFDDSAWKSGPALIGYETSALPEPLRTAANRTDAAGGVIRTHYFRTHFNFTGTPGEGVLSFRTVLDDAAAIYLNGVEIFRRRLPAGPIDWQTEGAGGAVGEAVYEGPFTVCVSNLLAGDNVLAAEVHQTGGNSSDMVWGLELSSLVQAITPVSILTQPTGTNVIEPQPFTLRVEARGSNPQYQWFRDGTAIDGATNATYTVSASNCDVDNGTYNVAVFNDAPSSVTSDAVTVNVTCDTIAPTVACLYGTNDAVVIQFSEVTTNGTDILNYIIQGSDGSFLAISSATYTSGTNTGTTVVLVIDPSTPRNPNISYSITIGGVADLFENFMEQVTLQIPFFASPPLIAMNSTHEWRYETSGTDLSNTWYAVGYDDSTWPTGLAMFDAKRPQRTDIAGEPVRTQTTLSNATGTAQIPTHYFRTTFSHSGPSTAVVCIRPFIDDGGVFYLNGQEILRVRMPAAPAPILYSTVTVGSVGDAAFEGPYYVCVTNLVSGSNQLAVEVHQQSLTSSDLTFGMELAVLSDAPPARLTITPGPGPGEVTVSWTGSGVLQSSTDLANPNGWSNVAGAAGNSYVTAATGNQFFRLAPAQ